MRLTIERTRFNSNSTFINCSWVPQLFINIINVTLKLILNFKPLPFFGNILVVEKFQMFKRQKVPTVFNYFKLL